MNIELVRRHSATYHFEDRTIGGFYIDGHWECWTLEDTDRYLERGGIKIPKETAIPRGRYQVIIDDSFRFKRPMPHILDVPQFTGIRIHILNTPAETEGCIGLGQDIDWNTKNLLRSRLAFEEFFPKLEWGLSKGKVWISIS